MIKPHYSKRNGRWYSWRTVSECRAGVFQKLPICRTDTLEECVKETAEWLAFTYNQAKDKFGGQL